MKKTVVGVLWVIIAERNQNQIWPYLAIFVRGPSRDPPRGQRPIVDVLRSIADAKKYGSICLRTLEYGHWSGESSPDCITLIPFKWHPEHGLSKLFI